MLQGGNSYVLVIFRQWWYCVCKSLEFLLRASIKSIDLSRSVSINQCGLNSAALLNTCLFALKKFCSILNITL